ncbi:MAG: alpha-ketoacid dehydrogenase subunit beta [Myxococcota bacterium]
MTSSFLDAIREALHEEFERDPGLLLFGQDVGAYGGAFGATRGLQERFGSQRVVDMPLSEAAVLGAACGAAMRGSPAIAELQFFDFASCAGFDQIVSVAAKSRYRTGIACPLVVRGPVGAGVRGGPFHSISPEMWFVGTPGLNVVFPSNPADAKGLLKSAIRDPDPVLFLEHKALYRRAKQDPRLGHAAIPLGMAQTVREGSSAVIFTYGAMVSVCVDAAERVEAQRGCTIRIVDLRALEPLDHETILGAVRETARALIVHEGPERGGFAGELTAWIVDRAFDALDAPVLRVAAANTPVPYAPVLEDVYLPGSSDVVSGIERLLDW